MRGLGRRAYHVFEVKVCKIVFASKGGTSFETLGCNQKVSSNPRGGTHHMHIRGGKSDIFGSEYCQK